MIKRVPFILFENILFYTCLAVSLLVVIWNSTNPTLDGPAHLYNAHTINYIAGGNEFIRQFYTLNKIPAANLTDHYLLALFMSVFSWEASEKLLVILYLLSFSILFRKLIRQWNQSNTGISIFAIPFSFSFLYYIGFYNFCLSFPLLFLVIIYYRKRFTGEGNKPSLKNYSILCLLATLIYFTNGLAFMFAGLALLLLAVPGFYSNRQINFQKLMSFSLVWFPGAVCFLIFIIKIPMETNPGIVPFKELMRWIYCARPLSVYTGDEDNYTRYISLLISIVLFTAIYFRIKNKSAFRFIPSDIFLVLSIITLACLIFVPDSASVGMMSIRFCYYFFIFLLIWIALQQGSKIVTAIITVALMAIHFIVLFKVHQPVISNLNKEVLNVRNAGTVIKPNSIVLVANVTDNFMLYHFPDYLGADKPIIIPGNYEPNYGWFATTWNNHKMPRILLDGKDSVPPNLNIHWVASSQYSKDIDYVFVYGKYTDFLQKEDFKTLNGILQKDYQLVYTSTDNSIHIFSLPVK
jgi:hypothetical protein